jgi:hypothetical protein
MERGSPGTLWTNIASNATIWNRSAAELTNRRSVDAAGHAEAASGRSLLAVSGARDVRAAPHYVAGGSANDAETVAAVARWRKLA